MKRTLFYTKGLIGLIALVTIFTACGRAAETSTPTPPEVEDSTQAPTVTEVSPTPTVSPTDEPLAARVNDQGITLAEYESELALFQLAKGLELTPEDRQRVLDNLIEQSLLSQAASEGGYVEDEAALQTRLEALEASLGSEAALAQWIDDHGYDRDLPGFPGQGCRGCLDARADHFRSAIECRAGARPPDTGL